MKTAAQKAKLPPAPMGGKITGKAKMAPGVTKPGAAKTPVKPAKKKRFGGLMSLLAGKKKAKKAC